MYGCESWTVKKAEDRRIDAFELWCWRTLESPLDCKEIKPVHSNQSWIFIGRTDSEAEAETPILWPHDVKLRLIRKDPDAGKDWRQKGMTEDEMVGWHHWLNGHEFEHTSWWTGKPSVLQSTESQRVGREWAAEQQQQKNMKLRVTNRLKTHVMCQTTDFHPGYVKSFYNFIIGSKVPE